MAARIDTERAVLADGGVRGIVVRPGLVYGNGGNSDLKSLIDRARVAGRAGHWGSGGTTQSYVHVEDLAELFCLAAEHAPHRAILHGVTDDVTQRELATAINQMIGAGEQTECLSLEQMLGITADTVGGVGSSLHRRPGHIGYQPVMNKRLSSTRAGSSAGRPNARHLGRHRLRLIRRLATPTVIKPAARRSAGPLTGLPSVTSWTRN
jgi:nucleoside-diphosphate-sugar epimerase